MAYDSARNQCVVFGGIGDAYLGDTWKYEGVNLGDMNADGIIDGLDIQPFVTAIVFGSSDAASVYLADFDSDGALTSADVDGFIDALLGS